MKNFFNWKMIQRIKMIISILPNHLINNLI